MAIFPRIYPHERTRVLLLSLALFLLLTAYYVLKVLREPLILLTGDAVERNFARGAEAVVLLLVIPAYSALADRVGARRLVGWIIAIFIVTLVAFQALSTLHLKLGFVFFVWLGIFSTMVVAQFWSLTIDLFTRDEGERLFPLIAFFGTLGAVAGAQLCKVLLGPIGARSLMGVAAGFLCAALATVLVVVRHEARRPSPAAQVGESDGRGGFRMVLTDRYLLLIALVVLLLNAVSSTGDFLLAQKVAHISRSGDAQQRIGSFYASFATWTSLITAVLQLLVVGPVLRDVGVGDAIVFAPIFSLLGYGVFAGLPVLPLIASFKVLESSNDYSLQNTAEQVLFLPTSQAAKYKAKTAIDTFAVRFGDLAAVGMVAVTFSLGLGIRAVAIENVILAALWLFVAVRLAAVHRSFPKPARS
jgi:AAA family ATP:ADP antiporter